MYLTKNLKFNIAQEISTELEYIPGIVFVHIVNGKHFLRTSCLSYFFIRLSLFLTLNLNTAPKISEMGEQIMYLKNVEKSLSHN